MTERDEQERDEREQDRRDEAGPEVLFQPPNPADLERFPPADASCRRVRVMLRDFVDDELPSGLRAEIESHVHAEGCRACGLALARAEHEVVTLRKALRKVALAPPSEDFTAGVLSRVTGMALTAGETPGDLTDRVMDRVRLEWSSPSAVSGRVARMLRWTRERPAAAAAGLLAALVMVVLGLVFLVPDRAQVPVRGRIGRMDQGVAVFAGGRELATDSAFLVGETIEVSGRGSVDLFVAGGAGGALVSHLVRVHGGGRLRALEDAFELVEGTLEVETDGGLSMVVPGHGTAVLESGRFWLDAMPVRRFDQALAVLGPETRLRLEAVEGRARVHGRGEVGARGGAALLIGANEVARFEPGAIAVVEPSPDALLRGGGGFGIGLGSAAPIAATRLDPDGEGVERWVGRVLRGQSDLPVVGASVRVQLLEHDENGAEKVRYEDRVTDRAGRFEFRGRALDGVVALVSVRPRVDSGVASLPCTPMPLIESGVGAGADGERVLRPILLDVDRPIAGTVLTPEGAPLAQAEVQALLVDEIFGIVEPIGAQTDWTDRDGRYRISGLPDRVEPHQRLVVLASHEDWASAALLGEVGRADSLADRASADVFVRRLERLELQGLARNRSRLAVFLEIPGLPPSAVVDRRSVNTDAEGRASVQGARGSLAWFDDGDRIVALRPSTGAARGAQGTVLAAIADEGTIGRIGRDQLDLDRRATPRALRVSRGHRFWRSDVPGAPALAYTARSVDPLLRDGDRLGPVPPRTQLFLHGADGSVAFLGELDAFGRLADGQRPRVPQSPNGSLVAIAPDGSIGSLALGGLDAEASGDARLELFGVGAARLEQALFDEVTAVTGGLASGMPMTVEFACSEGALAGQSFWRTVSGPGEVVDSLPAGSYRVWLPDGQSLEIMISAGTIVPLDH